MQEKSVLPDLNQDIYRRILTIIVRQKKNDLNEVMKEHAGSGYRNLFAKSVFCVLVIFISTIITQIRLELAFIQE